MATSVKQATCIKQACIQFPEKENMLKCTCIKQAPALSSSWKRKICWNVPVLSKHLP